MTGEMVAGRYRLGEPLGGGGMAEVFDAMDERLERPVAVKLLRTELSGDPGLRRRFEVEARAAARLVHPNVVGVFDTGELGDRPYIVMERLPGATLADRLREGRMDEPGTRRLRSRGGRTGDPPLSTLGWRDRHRDRPLLTVLPSRGR